MQNLQAYLVTEPYEGNGGVVFARSNIAARRIGADEWHDGDLGGMSVRRRRDLDVYCETGVPASLLILEGWRWESCFGCSIQIDLDALIENGRDPAKVTGIDGGRIFCCPECQESWEAMEARKECAASEFLVLLKQRVIDRVGPVDFVCDNETQFHASACVSDGHILIRSAAVSFLFPGGEHPVVVRYQPGYEVQSPEDRARRVHVLPERRIGPCPPQFWPTLTDDQAFNEWFDARVKERNAARHHVDADGASGNA